MNHSIILATIKYPYTPPKEKNLISDIAESFEVRRAIKNIDLSIESLIHELKKRDDVDTSKISIAGISFGAPFAIRAGQHIDDIKGVIVIHGFGRVDLALQRQLEMAWKDKPFYRPAAAIGGKFFEWFLDYPTPEAMAINYPKDKHVLLVSPEDDDVIPKQSIKALHVAFEQSDAQFTNLNTEGGHILPRKTKLINQIMSHCEDWMAKNNLLN